MIILLEMGGKVIAKGAGGGFVVTLDEPIEGSRSFVIYGRFRERPRGNRIIGVRVGSRITVYELDGRAVIEFAVNTY